MDVVVPATWTVRCRADVLRRVEAALGGKLEEAAALTHVREVAPNKRMLCVSFRLPAGVALRKRHVVFAQGAHPDSEAGLGAPAAACVGSSPGGGRGASGGARDDAGGASGGGEDVCGAAAGHTGALCGGDALLSMSGSVGKCGRASEGLHAAEHAGAGSAAALSAPDTHRGAGGTAQAEGLRVAEDGVDGPLCNGLLQGGGCGASEGEQGASNGVRQQTAEA